VWVRVPPPAPHKSPANAEVFLVCTQRSILTEGRIGDSFGDNHHRIGLEENRIHSLGGLFAHARQDVGVGPQGCGHEVLNLQTVLSLGYTPKSAAKH
jgi:hypothetical protein